MDWKRQLNVLATLALAVVLLFAIGFYKHFQTEYEKCTRAFYYIENWLDLDDYCTCFSFGVITFSKLEAYTPIFQEYVWYKESIPISTLKEVGEQCKKDQGQTL